MFKTIRNPLLILFCCISIAVSSSKSIDSAEIKIIGKAQYQDHLWRMTWIGTTLETRFAGTKIGFKILDDRNYYNLYIDDKLLQRIAPHNQEHDVWIQDLDSSEHTLRIIKTTESSFYAGRIGAFRIENGKWLPYSNAQKSQIEFIGDSWTAGLGNLSQTRECSFEESVQQTDITQSFAYLTAQHYKSEWQINAISGIGMNRNWNGNDSGKSLRTYYPRILQYDSSQTYSDSKWQPKLYIIGLGINDFSTDLRPTETWTDSSLSQAFIDEYQQLILRLHHKSPSALIIVSHTFLWPKDRLRPLASKLVQKLRQDGNHFVFDIEYKGIDLNGCLWHPSQRDHQKISKDLIALIDSIQKRAHDPSQP